jgi:ribosomal protein L29
MKAKELKQKNKKELEELLIQSRHKLGQIKFEISSQKINNFKEIGDLRRTIARIMTILNNGKQTGKN